MVRLPRNEKQTYRLNSRAQMWPSGLTLAMTLTLNFHGQIQNLLYLSQKWSDCHETKSKHIDWTLVCTRDSTVLHLAIDHIVDTCKLLPLICKIYTSSLKCGKAWQSAVLNDVTRSTNEIQGPWSALTNQTPPLNTRCFCTTRLIRYTYDVILVWIYNYECFDTCWFLCIYLLDSTSNQTLLKSCLYVKFRVRYCIMMHVWEVTRMENYMA